MGQVNGGFYQHHLSVDTNRAMWLCNAFCVSFQGRSELKISRYRLLTSSFFSQEMTPPWRTTWVERKKVDYDFFFLLILLTFTMEPVRIRHSIREIATQPVTLRIELGGRPKWLWRNFWYHEVMRTAPIIMMSSRNLQIPAQLIRGMLAVGKNVDSRTGATPLRVGDEWYYM